MKTIIKKHPELFARIDEFNRLPARYMHISWADEWIGSALYAFLKSSTRVEKRLSFQILTHAGLHTRFIYDFSDPRRLLALLDADRLGRLVFFTGIAANAWRIGRVVGREPLKQIKRQLGVDGYRFALHKAPLLTGCMRDEHPEKFSISDIAGYVNSCGMRYLQICLGGQPHALTGRLALKFPRQLNLEFNAPAADQESNRVWQLLRKILIYEVGPEWKMYIS